MKFTVIWQSNFNGVIVTPTDITDYDTLTEEQQDILYEIEDEASDTLPGYTYKIASRWDELTEKKIKKLKKRALKIINKHYPDVTIDDVSYDEDCYST